MGLNGTWDRTRFGADKANRWRLFTPAIAILPQIGNNGAQLGDSTAAAPSWSTDNEPRRAIRMVARSRSTAVYLALRGLPLTD
jgi:hypothetical protein